MRRACFQPFFFQKKENEKRKEMKNEKFMKKHENKNEKTENEKQIVFF